jgi:hypothetical protein
MTSTLLYLHYLDLIRENEDPFSYHGTRVQTRAMDCLMQGLYPGEWEAWDEDIKSRQRSRVHDKKRFGERWWRLVIYRSGCPHSLQLENRK